MPVFEQLKLWRRALIYRYRVDPGEINYILHHLSKGDIAFDIGAHKGAYTFWMRQSVGKSGKVIAFEPQPQGFTFLQQLFNTSYWSNIKIENFALSDSSTEKKFYIQQQPFNVSYEASLEKKYTADYTEQIVQTITVDHYCKTNNIIPAFIKIDVEGHEWEVLNGAAEILTAYHPAILLECEARHIGKEKVFRCFNFLTGLGYRGFFIHHKIKRSLQEFDISKHQNQSGDKFWESPDYCNNFIFEKEV